MECRTCAGCVLTNGWHCGACPMLCQKCACMSRLFFLANTAQFPHVHDAVLPVVLQAPEKAIRAHVAGALAAGTLDLCAHLLPSIMAHVAGPAMLQVASRRILHFENIATRCHACRRRHAARGRGSDSVAADAGRRRAGGDAGRCLHRAAARVDGGRLAAAAGACTAGTLGRYMLRSAPPEWLLTTCVQHQYNF